MINHRKLFLRLKGLKLDVKREIEKKEVVQN